MEHCVAVIENGMVSLFKRGKFMTLKSRFTMEMRERAEKRGLQVSRQNLHFLQGTSLKRDIELKRSERVQMPQAHLLLALMIFRVAAMFSLEIQGILLKKNQSLMYTLA